jgi:putative FmdB family regulatory protein
MPTYEYRCKDCGDELEVFQSFHDEPLTTCPACGGNLRKVFGNIGITFKGSGFYKTDSRNGSAKKKESAASDSSSSSESSTTGGSSESKSSETKSDTKSSESSKSSGSPASGSKAPVTAAS